MSGLLCIEIHSVHPISNLLRHPTEPTCNYDPVEGLTLAPDTDPIEKIKQLEDQIGGLLVSRPPVAVTKSLVALLKQRLSDKQSGNRSTSPSHNGKSNL